MAITRTPKKKLGTKEMSANAVTRPKDDKRFFLSKGYLLSKEITEDGEYPAEVKEFHESETKACVRLTPYSDESGRRVYYEDVFLYLTRSNNPSSAAGQFLGLFAGARHWGDIVDRIVGIEIKLNPGREGKVFKNIVRVFETSADDLVFDDEHMAYPVMESKKTIVNVVEECEDDEEEYTPNTSKFSDDIFDEEDVDEEDDEYEEEEE